MQVADISQVEVLKLHVLYQAIIYLQETHFCNENNRCKKSISRCRKVFATMTFRCPTLAKAAMGKVYLDEIFGCK